MEAKTSGFQQLKKILFLQNDLCLFYEIFLPVSFVWDHFFSGMQHIEENEPEKF